MTASRPERPVTRAEEIALAEARDLPPRLDSANRRDPLADLAERERDLHPEGGTR